MACQASLMVSGALASYDIPPQRTGRSHAHARHAEPDSSMPAWLADCISEAAKYLDQAPFLQLLLPTKARAGSSFQRHRVTTAVVQVRLCCLIIILTLFLYWLQLSLFPSLAPCWSCWAQQACGPRAISSWAASWQNGRM